MQPDEETTLLGVISHLLKDVTAPLRPAASASMCLTIEPRRPPPAQGPLKSHALSNPAAISGEYYS